MDIEHFDNKFQTTLRKRLKLSNKDFDKQILKIYWSRLNPDKYIFIYQNYFYIYLKTGRSIILICLLEKIYSANFFSLFA